MAFYIYSALTLCWVGFPLLCSLLKRIWLSCLATLIRLKGETSEFELEDEEKTNYYCLSHSHYLS